MILLFLDDLDDLQTFAVMVMVRVHVGVGVQVQVEVMVRGGVGT